MLREREISQNSHPRKRKARQRCAARPRPKERAIAVAHLKNAMDGRDLRRKDEEGRDREMREWTDDRSVDVGILHHHLIRSERRKERPNSRPAAICYSPAFRERTMDGASKDYRRRKGGNDKESWGEELSLLRPPVSCQGPFLFARLFSSLPTTFLGPFPRLSASSADPKKREGEKRGHCMKHLARTEKRESHENRAASGERTSG